MRLKRLLCHYLNTHSEKLGTCILKPQKFTNPIGFSSSMRISRSLSVACSPRSGGTCLESSFLGHAGSPLVASYADDCLGQVFNAGV
jgi:hypothetical protein